MQTRLDPDLVRQVADSATREQRSLSGQIAFIIRDYYRRLSAEQSR